MDAFTTILLGLLVVAFIRGIAGSSACRSAGLANGDAAAGLAASGGGGDGGAACS